MNAELLFALHITSTALMTGVIWIVQLVVYPGFAFVAREQFADVHHRYTAAVGLVVGPAMVAELATGAMLLMHLTGHVLSLMVFEMAILGLAWLSTVFVQVPCHNQLQFGYEEKVYVRLVRTNWLRTTAWSLRTALLVLVAPAVCGS